MKKYLSLFVLIVLLSGCNKAAKIADPIATPKVDDVKIEIKNEAEIKNMEITKMNEGQEDLTTTYKKAVIKTNLGDITVALYADESPKTVNNFLNLAKVDFYSGVKFHRVMKDFMIQGGDPNSKSADRSIHGTGGPGYAFDDEFNKHQLVRGSLAMANSGPNTNGSQFFIVTAESTPWLDGKHTNFGEVVSGMDVVDKIEAVKVDERSNPLKDVVIKSVDLVK